MKKTFKKKFFISMFVMCVVSFNLFAAIENCPNYKTKDVLCPGTTYIDTGNCKMTNGCVDYGTVPQSGPFEVEGSTGSAITNNCTPVCYFRKTCIKLPAGTGTICDIKMTENVGYGYVSSSCN